MKEYYSVYYNEYFRRTVSIDSGLFLSQFSYHLEPGAYVLDIGCGSGRDLLWLRKRGMKPVGLERSEKLAELAEKHSGCEVIVADYELFDFSTILAGGLLFSASLVHIPHERMRKVIGRALKALLENGCIYISLKEGQGTKRDSEGRLFYLWSDKDLRILFADLNLKVVHFSRSASLPGNEVVWLGYVLKDIISQDQET